MIIYAVGHELHEAVVDLASIRRALVAADPGPDKVYVRVNDQNSQRKEFTKLN